MVANSNDYVGTHHLVMKATVDSDQTVYSTVDFDIEILENTHPTIDPSTTAVTIKEGYSASIELDMEDDIEYDVVSVSVELYDSYDILVSQSMDWFDIKLVSTNKVIIEINEPLINSALSFIDYSIIVKVWD